MDKGDKLEKKIEEHLDKIKSNLAKVKELEKALGQIETKEEEA